MPDPDSGPTLQCETFDQRALDADPEGGTAFECGTSALPNIWCKITREAAGSSGAGAIALSTGPSGGLTLCAQYDVPSNPALIGSWVQLFPTSGPYHAGPYYWASLAIYHTIDDPATTGGAGQVCAMAVVPAPLAISSPDPGYVGNGMVISGTVDGAAVDDVVQVYVNASGIDVVAWGAAKVEHSAPSLFNVRLGINDAGQLMIQDRHGAPPGAGCSLRLNHYHASTLVHTLSTDDDWFYDPSTAAPALLAYVLANSPKLQAILNSVRQSFNT